MSAAASVGGSIVTGIVLALLAVLGGISAITPSANAAADSEQVVLYDAR